MLDLNLSVSDDLDLGALICEEILDKSFHPLSPMLSVVLSRTSVVGRLGNCPDKMPVRFLNISFLSLTLLSLHLFFSVGRLKSCLAGKLFQFFFMFNCFLLFLFFLWLAG